MPRTVRGSHGRSIYRSTRGFRQSTERLSHYQSPTADAHACASVCKIAYLTRTDPPATSDQPYSSARLNRGLGGDGLRPTRTMRLDRRKGGRASPRRLERAKHGPEIRTSSSKHQDGSNPSSAGMPAAARTLARLVVTHPPTPLSRNVPHAPHAVVA